MNVIVTKKYDIHSNIVVRRYERDFYRIGRRHYRAATRHGGNPVFSCSSDGTKVIIGDKDIQSTRSSLSEKVPQEASVNYGFSQRTRNAIRRDIRSLSTTLRRPRKSTLSPPLYPRAYVRRSLLTREECVGSDVRFGTDDVLSSFARCACDRTRPIGKDDHRF